MKIVKANAQLFDPEQLKMSPYQFIERIGRICYKSEDKITQESAVKFVNALAKNQHTAMFEHAHLYMTMSRLELFDIKILLDLEAEQIHDDQVAPLRDFFKITSEPNIHVISANFRAWSQLLDWYSHLPSDLMEKLFIYTSVLHNDEACEDYPDEYMLKDLQDVLKTKDHTIIKTICELKMRLHDKYPEIFRNACSSEECNAAHTIIGFEELEIFENNTDIINKIRRLCKTKEDADIVIKKHVVHTIIFTCDRGITHEFVRHRPASFAQESTRYCNYGSDKFGREITVIEPCYWDKGTQPDTYDIDVTKAYNAWYEACLASEKAYFEILDNKGTPQQARGVLPTDVKTEIAITATENEWAHIINLRLIGTTGSPHPKMVEVMKIAYPQLVTISEDRLKTI